MRKISRLKKPVLLLLAILGWGFAFGQQSTDSLMQYLEIAAKNNPGVLSKYSEYMASLEKVPQAGSLPDPELSIGVFLQPMELMEGYQNADLRLMQMFPWFGVLKNAKDEMSLMAKAKYESFRDAKANLFFDVQRTWYELIRYQQELKILASNMEILKTIERLTLVRFQSPLTVTGNPSSSGGIPPAGNSTLNSSVTQGMNSMSKTGQSNTSVSEDQTSSMPGSSMGSLPGGSGLADLYRISIEVNDLQNSILSLKNQMTTSSVRFNTYLNRPVLAAITLPDTLRHETLNMSLTAVTDSMLTNNPMLGMLKYEKQSLDARYRMVTAMGYPMIGLGVNYSVISRFSLSSSPMNGKDMIMPMVTVTLPVYRKKYRAMKSEAELLSTATEQGYSEASNSLRSEYYQALQQYQDAIRREKLYNDQFQLADKSMNIILKSFSSSGAGLTDILRVRQQTLDYKFKIVEAVSDYNTAVAWLKRLGNLEIIGNKQEL